jgi:hypothetical protein
MECSDKCPMAARLKRLRITVTSCEYHFYDNACLYPAVHAFQMERMECDEKGDKG